MEISPEEQEIRSKIARCAEQFETQDSFMREADLIRWSRNEYYWKGLQYIFWDKTSMTWQVPNFRDLVKLDEDIMDDLLYSKVVNIYKAHGQSIVAALSIEVPDVKFFPDDADDPEDVSTAKAYRKMGDLIQTHNKAKLLFMHALFILFNQDFVAAYSYKKDSPKFGTWKRDVFGSVDVLQCASCGQTVAGGAAIPQPGLSGAIPQPDMVNSTVQQTNDACPYCGDTQAPMPGQEVQKIGEEDTPKNRIIIEVFGPLNVKIPPKAVKQEHCSYLILETDLHPTILKDLYGDQVDLNDLAPTALNTDKRYRGIDRVYVDPLVTVKRCWLRPSAFEVLGVQEDVMMLKQLYPNGVYAVIVNGKCLEMRAEDLDDYWTVSYDPLATALHSQPLGEDLIPIQDIKNDLTNYTLQTIEYGIPETFADMRAINWDAYGKQKSRHGMVVPARKPSSGSMSDNFHEVKTASISREIQEFTKGLDEDAQFVLGDYPSVYGGPSQGSKTLGEYAMSRNQALQRLSNTWTVLSYWWTDVIYKACELFKDIIETQGDQITVAENAGNFINSFIRKSELLGKVGNVQPESDEKFPVSMSQKRDLLMQVIQLQSPEINSVIFAPENAETMASIFGFDDIVIPGQEQIGKQIAETQQLLESAPIGNMPSVPIDPNLDDNEVHSLVLRNFLVGFRGQEIRVTNPLGFQNCMLHLEQHQAILAAQQAAMMAAQQPQEGKPNASVQPSPR